MLVTSAPTVVPVVSLIVPAFIGPENVVVPMSILLLIVPVGSWVYKI
jgi:hypothetical protein